MKEYETMANRVAFLLPLFAAIVVSAIRDYGIPGTTSTRSGYDVELGTDAMCWTSKGSNLDSSDTAFVNPLVENFRLSQPVRLLRSCPEGNEFSAEAPPEFVTETRLRTRKWYNFTVNLQLNASSLAAVDQNVADFSFVSDEGPRVAVQIMACEMGAAGFCSPYKHEEASARLAAENKTEDLKQGDSHGGTHIHSGYHFLDLPPVMGHLHNENFTIPMIVNTQGSYFHIAALQLFLRDSTGSLLRYDVSTALPIKQRVIEFVDPPRILEVSRQTQNLLLFANGFVTCIIGTLLWQTIRHRNHQIMALTQGHFLIVYLVAAMVVTSASSMFDPRNSFDCRFGVPVVLVSAHLMYSVMLGRLWRINSVGKFSFHGYSCVAHFVRLPLMLVSPLLAQTLRQRERSSLLSVFHRQETKELRKTVSWQNVALRVALFLGPQVVLQLAAVILQPAQSAVVFNADETTGRPHCCVDVPIWQTISVYGYACFALLVLILLVTAYETKNLPSLFNETRDIFDSTLGTVVVLLLGLGILQVASRADSSPEIDLLVREALILTGTLNATIRVIMPKLRMIWRGETVLVSKVMSDHRERVHSKDILYLKKQRRSRKRSQVGLSESAIRSSHQGSHSSGETSFDFCDFDEEEPDGSFYRTGKMVVKRNEAPERRLVLKLFQAQNRLTKITESIVSGSVVPEEDWIQLRQTSHSLSHMFHHEVEFFWERKLRTVAEERPGYESELHVAAEACVA